MVKVPARYVYIGYADGRLLPRLTALLFCKSPCTSSSHHQLLVHAHIYYREVLAAKEGRYVYCLLGRLVGLAVTISTYRSHFVSLRLFTLTREALVVA